MRKTVFVLFCLGFSCTHGSDDKVNSTIVDQRVDRTTPRDQAADQSPSDASADRAADGSADASIPEASIPDASIPDASLDGSVDVQIPPDVAVDIQPDKGPLVGLAYPTRDPYRIKGLQPDFWSDRNGIAGNNTGGIAVNLVWASWEPSVKSAPCSASEEQFFGRCFKVDPNVDAEIKAYTALGVVVTGVLYGVPAWARTGKVCSPISPSFEIFCTPNNADDYGRFAQMIARRYNGFNGHGRVADFVIHNEVNANDWFDIGCGQGTPCDMTKWVDEYAANFNAAYDGIVTEQSEAKVLVSLEHHFGTTFDNLTSANPKISGETFLQQLAPLVAPRAWRLAFHSYPPNLLAAEFSPLDYPRVTFGNLGVLLGWLRTTFASTPSAWEVQLTENGINSYPPSSPQKQSAALCDAFRNVLGTPGIESFIYHRMKDHPDEVAFGLGLGLRNADNSAKPAWATWAMANRNDLSPPQLSCGFEHLPNTRLARYHKAFAGHWASSRLPPAGFTEEAAWYLHRKQKPGTKMLYECLVGSHNRITDDIACNGQQLLGPVGYIHTTQVAGSVALYACEVGAGADHFISPQAGCEGQGAGQLLGYALQP